MNMLIHLVLLAALPADAQITLWKEIDLKPYRGSFVSPGDLDGDGKVDFLLSCMGPHTTPAYLAAIDLSGRKLWEVGDASINTVGVAGYAREPTCRGIASIYDVDGDGRAEVIAELWSDDRPMLCLVDGASGRIKRQIPSPLDMSVRQPEGYRSSRPVPMALIARLNGPDAPPTIVLKYEASNTIPCHAFGLNGSLELLWHLETRPTGMGHTPTVADIDDDGREEIVLGETVVGAKGTILWQQEFGIHADCTSVCDVAPSPGKEVLMSICQQGPAYCLSDDGRILWQKTRQDVPHGQAIWAGDFIEEVQGVEVVILRSGHVGDFLSVRGSDGTELARFQHRSGLTRQGRRLYPDFPVKIRWKGPLLESLWLPIDRTLVDGRGRVVQDLGLHDEHVQTVLHCGTSKRHLAAQAIALDICGDEREELILYQPYDGEAILIFTQPDSDGKEKPYVHQPAAYNFRSYF